MSEQDLDTKKAIRRTSLIAVGAVFVVVAAFFWKVTEPRALKVSEMRNNGLIMFEIPRRINPFSLLDHNGDPFSQDDLVGKWSMIFPGFTYCPDICPTTMAQLGQMWEFLDDKTRKDLNVIMLSVDPNRDTVEKMGLYVPYFNEDFIGLTGDLGTIVNLTRELNIAFDIINPNDAPEEYDVAHTANIVLVNPEGHYAGFFKPPFDPAILKLTYESAWVRH